MRYKGAAQRMDLLGGISRAVRLRLGWILLVGMLTAGAASVYSLLQDERYSASATLSPGPAGVDQASGSRRAGTKIEVASRNTIARRTRRRMELRADIAAEKAVSNVEVRTHGDRIQVEASAGNPRTAALVANTFADEYVAFRRDVVSRLRSLKGRSQELQALASLHAPNATVVDRATPPGSPSSPRPVRNTVIGALAGLLLGFGLVIVRGRHDRRLRDPRDLEEAFGLPVVASLPESEALGQRLGLTHHLPPLEAEAFRVLSARLCHFEPERMIDSVLVTSAGAGDGKSTVAFNLAAAAAASGLKVLLVEAEVRRPMLARSLGLPPNEGLTSVLAAELPLRDACREVLLPQDSNGGDSLATMFVLPAGETRPEGAELVESARMEALMEECKRSYSLVVIDSPRARLVSDGISLMSDVSAVVVVGRIGKLTNEEAASLRDRLEQIDAPTFGIVANFAET